MDCEYYQELMSRMLDGDLSADETEALLAHVQSCASCRAVFTAFADFSACLKAPPVEPPAALREAVMAGIRPKEKKKEPIPLILKIFVPMAACFALLAAGAVYLNNYGANTSASVDSALQMTASAPESYFGESSSDSGEPEVADMNVEIPSGESTAFGAEVSTSEPDSGTSQQQSGTADTTAKATGGSTSSLPSTADVYDGNGNFAGSISADGVETFLNTVCTDGGSTNAASESPSYTVDCGGVTYELLAQNGALWWRVSGETAYNLSPSSGDDFLALVSK